MAINYSKHVTTKTRSNKTPATTKAAPSQVPNSTGGFVWEVNDWDRLTRFLILGAEGGTYYVGEADLVKSNHSAILRCIKTDGVRTVREIVDVSDKGRAYKNDPAVFALALCATHGDEATRSAAFTALPKVCRIGTHLFHFMQYITAMRGTGRALRRAVGNWYTQMPDEKLAMQAIKYQQRDGWSHRDLLRLSHPKTTDNGTEAVLRWMVGGIGSLEARTVARKATKRSMEYPSVIGHLPPVIKAFEEAKTASEKKLIELITEHNLPREAVPTEKLNSPAVWEALLQKMPLNAMIRSLGKMSAVGLVKPLSSASKLVVKKLSDAEHLRKSRVHPMQVLLAAKVYAQGRGMKGSLTWNAVPNVLSALDAAFYATFTNVVPCDKPMLIGLDVSGSMSAQMAGNPISSCEAVAALSLIHVSIEEECHVFGFANDFRELGIRKGMTLVEAARRAQISNFGSTNIGLCYEYAIGNKLEVGAFIAMTDNEVNSGHQPFQRLREYRNRYVPDARSIVVGTTSTPFTVNNPDDKFGLDVAGFDSAVPALIADFIRGDTEKPKEVVEDAPAED